MGIHYLTFMGGNLENKTNLTPVRMMISAGSNGQRIVSEFLINNTGMDNDFHVKSARNITPPKLPSANTNA